MLAEQLSDHDDTPLEDKIVVLRGLNWHDYQRMLEARGDAGVPRFAFLGGELEIMTPSRPHESIKSRIGLLVAVWCEVRGVEFSPYGSWTLEDERTQRGLEPDECYVFGAVAEPQRPDLAIEVVWTAGGLRKLDIYAALGVPEVWFWRRGRITVHLLEQGAYAEVPESRALPGMDLLQLASYLDRPTASQAIREYRAALT
ncbi:MAG TPA: Uma2 family endonuclease [Polyangiaceae bacterium]|nr:Uma2 family endonuclease [Polyangiaceae bacterium]